MNDVDLMTRRTLLHRAAGLGVAASTLGALDLLALLPARASAKTKSALPEIQFQIEKFIAPAFKVEGVRVRLAPVYTTFATFALTRTPTQADQATLARALASIEASYRVQPERRVHDGRLRRFPTSNGSRAGWPARSCRKHMPRLLSEPQAYALEEAVPGPTDVSPENPEVSKLRFDIPVQIESNDMLVTLRSDSTEIIDDVLAWLSGESSTLAGEELGSSGLRELLTVTSRRLMFTQIGLPRTLAEEQGLPYAEMINPQSPMWMGFISQQVGTSGAPPITTFLGNGSAKLTTARPRRLLRPRLDRAPFTRDPGPRAVLRKAQRNVCAARGGDVQRRSRPEARQRGPVHQRRRADRRSRTSSPAPSRPSAKPKGRPRSTASRISPTRRRCSAPAGRPTASRCTSAPTGRASTRSTFPTAPSSPSCTSASSSRPPRSSRRCAAARPRWTSRRSTTCRRQNLGLERFLTATRRQNFLVPPRRNRAFPLVELA